MSVLLWHIVWVSVGSFGELGSCMGQVMGHMGARCVVGAAGGWVLDCEEEMNIYDLPVA